jgi:glutathione S-transferase
VLTLHYYPSNASLAPHIVLEELRLQYELVLVDRSVDAHKSPEYLRLNPNGLIPVLVDGDLVLYESAAICLHLVDAHPERGLAPPPGTPERAHFYKWLVWLTNTLQATLLVYFYPERWADDERAAAQIKAHAEDRVAPLLDRIEEQLARHGGPWLLGADYSAADAYAFMLCRWTRGFARPARSLPLLGAYLQRLLARDSVRRVIERERLPEPYV